MSKKLVRAILSIGLAAFVLLIAAGTGWTQVTTGDIRGRVLDTGQQPIEGVQISVTDTRTNTTTGTLTNSDGRYVVRFLRPGGPYTVTAQSIGYRAVARSGVAVTLSQAQTVDFQLETSAVEVAPLTVAVEGTDAIISRTHTGAQTTVGQKEITDFPTFERQITDFAILSPYSNRIEGSPSIAGQNNRYNTASGRRAPDPRLAVRREAGLFLGRPAERGHQVGRRHLEGLCLRTGIQQQSRHPLRGNHSRRL
jgi:hypothetical protein